MSAAAGQQACPFPQRPDSIPTPMPEGFPASGEKGARGCRRGRLFSTAAAAANKATLRVNRTYPWLSRSPVSVIFILPSSFSAPPAPVETKLAIVLGQTAAHGLSKLPFPSCTCPCIAPSANLIGVLCDAESYKNRLCPLATSTSIHRQSTGLSPNLLAVVGIYLACDSIVLAHVERQGGVRTRCAARPGQPADDQTLDGRTPGRGLGRGRGV